LFLSFVPDSYEEEEVGNPIYDENLLNALIYSDNNRNNPGKPVKKIELNSFEVKDGKSIKFTNVIPVSEGDLSLI